MKQNIHLLYQEYKNLLQKAADFNFAVALLGWDQEVYMPQKGAEARGRQLATLATEAHKILTCSRLGDVLDDLKQLLSDDTENLEYQHNVRLSLLDYEKNIKLPEAFVEEMSLLTSSSFNAWVDARNKNDYKIFAPFLEKMIALKRKQAAIYGYTAHPYDALLNDYERGATVAMLDPLFKTVQQQLPLILDNIKLKQQVDNSCLHQLFAERKQWDFSIQVLKQMGFDFDAGRQDYSEHPFTTSFSAKDVRLTTRVDENNFASMLWSCIHEGGHGLYEQGLPDSQYGLPLGEAASLGIHESQSRLWENCVGRGLDFWNFFYPQLQLLFPEQLKNININQFYKAINKVAPSLIRTEADELTYHFHVLIRYELEKALMEGTLSPADLPQEWNKLYKKYLGIEPQDYKTGVLQDVHWSHGLFGYFPTYTLGSFYAAQIFEAAKTAIADIEPKIAKGNFTVLLNWLRGQVHQHGRMFTSEQLCERITGKKLDPTVFMNYAKKKFESVYE